MLCPNGELLYQAGFFQPFLYLCHVGIGHDTFQVMQYLINKSSSLQSQAVVTDWHAGLLLLKSFSFHFFLAIFSHRHLFFACLVIVDQLLLSEVVRTRIGHLLKSGRIKFFLPERAEWLIASFHDHRPNSGVLYMP